MAPRCRAYLTDTDSAVDVDIREEKYEPERWPGMSHDLMCYMESGELFYLALLGLGGMMLHASAVEYEGNAYLFSGPSGVGKSTHTRQWQQTFGDAVQVFNDDKPALRFVDGGWYAYGTPWCGKDGINQNMRSPLAGICFLKQAKENRIRQLTATEALRKILSQTIHKFHNIADLDLLLSHLGNMLGKIPVFEMENLPQPEAAILSYETMHKCAGEMSL